MRSRKKFYLGILLSLVITVTTVFPAMASEENMVDFSEEIFTDISETEFSEKESSLEAVPGEETDSVVDPVADVESASLLDDPVENFGLDDHNEENESIYGDDEESDIAPAVIKSVEEEETEEEEVGEKDIEPEFDIVVYDVILNEEDSVKDNGFYQDSASGDWYYYVDGQIDSERNDVIKDTEKQIDSTAGWWYVVGGKVQMDFTGLADYRNENGWWYITNGKVDFTVNTVAKNKNGWYYVEGGKVDLGYNGFASNSKGSWYIENGKVTFNKNSVIKDTDGAIGTIGIWYYVVGSKVQYDFTGLANYKNSNGWWYIKDGVVDFSANTVAKNNNGWYYVAGGKVDFSYTGFAINSNGSWYIEEGKVKFNKNSVIKDTTGTLGAKGTWYYVVGSKVQYDYTGVSDYKNSNGWWYIADGKVDFSYNGFSANKNGSWYVEDGKVRFDKNSVIKDTGGAIGTKGTWYYVVGSKVQYDFTGLANYKNSNGWWYIDNGVVDFTANTVAKNNNGWYYIEGGKVIFSFNGIAKNSNGWWYIKDGKVDFSYNGTVTVTAGTYSVVDGKVQNVSLSDVVSSSIKDDTDESEDEDNSDSDNKSYEYDTPSEYIKYGGTDTNTLTAPQFTGSVNSNGVMTLSWEPVSGAAKYRVFIREYSNGSWGSWTKLTDTTSTSYTGDVWTESKLYQYTVRCLDSDGNYASPYISGYSGSAVAEYAQLFVGNPYVYGGSSLTNGCDCSGFIMQVYAHFGIFLPHQSGMQITLGSEVAYADMQPGDIIGRSGHTMLYIGDGKVVHAQDSQHGITISDVSSMSYTNIRRIF